MNLQALSGLTQIVPQFTSDLVKSAIEYEKTSQRFYALGSLFGYDSDKLSTVEKMTKELSKYNGLSTRDTLDYLTSALYRQSLMCADVIGLQASRIKRQQNIFCAICGVSPDIAFRMALEQELAIAIRLYEKPYSIKTQVVDLGNGYGRVDYILGNDLLIPANYAQAIMRTAISQMQIPKLVETAKMRDSISRFEIPRIADIGTKVQYAKVDTLKLEIKPLYSLSS